MTLAQVRRYALSLSGATEEPHFNRTSFRVSGKIFVTAKATDTHIHVFVPEREREPALAMHPEFISKLLWGGKVVGIRVELPHAHASTVRDLLREAWQSKAPKQGGASRAKSRS